MKTLAAKIKTKIVAPDFDFKQSAKLRACIEISIGEILTALFTQQSELVYLQTYAFNSAEKVSEVFEHLTQTEPFFSQQYLNVYVGLLNDVYTIVPNALFSNESKEQWLTFNHQPQKDELVLCDDLYSTDSKCVYSIDEKLKTKIDETFPNNSIKHKVSYLSESLAALASKKAKTCLVHVSGVNFDIALYNKKMLFFNSFEYETPEDFLYFILASLEQNGCLVNETEVVFSGEIEAQSALHDFLKQYFPKIKFATHNKSIILKNDFEKLPNHFYFSLFNLYLCAL